ncbi:putative expansin-A7 [Iris pallida]|uniref:Expansin-A7 n=1 Tax=Iris pallida TaxID=29817 RepID=A0AAX6FGJ2_IRIPA|nr:putative expansin-A7 [Iris pallida]
MAERPRHILRRQRRLRHNGRSLWIREPVQPGVRGGDGGAEHGAVQRGAELRRVLRDQVRRGPPVVPLREPLHLRHRHQLLPPQLRPPLRQRRLVQPPSPPLRPRHAHVPQDRRVPRRHRPRLLPQGSLQEIWRDPVHNQRVQVLQPGPDQQRGRSRGRSPREHKGVEDRMDAHVPQLGPELAVQRRPRGPGHLLPCHRKRPQDLHLLERRPRRLAVRPDLRRKELQGLIVRSVCHSHFHFYSYNCYYERDDEKCEGGNWKKEKEKSKSGCFF